MSPATVLPGWYPLLLSRDLRARPVTRCFAGSQLILRRTAEGCIEVEDRAYEGSLAERKRALRQSKKFLEQFMG